MAVKVCTHCVMDDSSDPTITFDENGVCSYCSNESKRINTTTYFPGAEGEKRLSDLIAKLKKENAKNQYDCLMGISGGLDSSYLAYLGYKWGLRILAVHIDDGFDTEASKKNVRNLIEKTNIKMLTIKPNPEEFYDLTKAFLKAGVPNIAIPQDNVLFAFLYDIAKKNHLNAFLSGGNFALECVLQRGNTHSYLDLKHIKNIHKKFGTKPINDLKLTSYWRKYANGISNKLITYRPLDLIDYNRDRAISELHDFCGFEYYGSKHLENYFTAFAQLYWLPKKFGVDKRKSHFSSMIVSGQMTRDQALEELKKPIYDEKFMDKCFEEVESKLGLTHEELMALVTAKNKSHEDYKTDKMAQFFLNRKHKSR